MPSVNVSSVKGKLFFRPTTKGRKLFLYSEIRESEKRRMLFKNRNRQQRIDNRIWLSMFMFNQQFLSITVFYTVQQNDEKLRTTLQRWQ